MYRLRIISAALLVVMVWGCVEQEPFRPTADDKRKIRENLLAKAPAIKHKVNADLEGKVVYLGLDVDQDVITPGKQFKLTHYWQVKKAVSGWRLFVHLNSDGKKDYINADHKPINDRYPVTLWKPGQIVRDIHTVTLPGNWKSDKVGVYVGLWKPKNLRMKIKGPQDDESRIIAAILPVKGGKPAAPVKPRRLVALRAQKPITIDGKLDEPEWAKAVSTGAFVETMKGGRSPVKTEAKAVWDDKHLYLAFMITDEHIWSTLKKRDDKLWTQEAVEIFIDANADGKDYVELQTNPNGAIFDTYLPSYRKRTDAWNSKMKVGIKVDGTVNNKDDKDKGWVAEIAIPWADTKGQGTYKLELPPRVGAMFRVNLFRLDNPPGKPQIFSGWSPPMEGDLHVLKRFGELYFGDEQGKLPRPSKAAEPKAKKEEGKQAKAAPANEQLPPGVVRMKAIQPQGLIRKIPRRIPPSAVPIEKAK